MNSTATQRDVALSQAQARIKSCPGAAFHSSGFFALATTPISKAYRESRPGSMIVSVAYPRDELIAQAYVPNAAPNIHVFQWKHI